MGLWKRGRQYWADFSIGGKRYRKRLGTTKLQEAKRRERELLEAAATGELQSPQGVERQARCLVADPRFIDTLEVFHRDLTRTYRLDEVGHDDPNFTEQMREANQQERAAWRLVEASLRAHTVDHDNVTA